MDQHQSAAPHPGPPDIASRNTLRTVMGRATPEPQVGVDVKLWHIQSSPCGGLTDKHYIHR